MDAIVYNVGKYRNSIKNWWVPLLLGILFVLTGLFVFIDPVGNYASLSLIFGIMVMVSGILGIYLGINTPAQSGKGWLIATGIIELFLGVLMITMHTLLVTVLPYFLGFWLIFRGLTTIGIASDMFGYGIKGAGLPLILGILAVTCSFFILIQSIIGTGAIIIWTGLSLIFTGIAFAVFAFNLRRLGKFL